MSRNARRFSFDKTLVLVILLNLTRGKMGKLADQEYWQRYKEKLFISRSLKHQLEAKAKPCGGCGQPHSMMKPSKMYYDEMFCGYCAEDMANGQDCQRRKW